MRLRATSRSTLLSAFNEAGILDVADVHIGRRLAGLCQESNECVWLAAALTVRALRLGSSCLDLRTAETSAFDLDGASIDTAVLEWPTIETWEAAVVASPMVTVGPEPMRGHRPLRFVNGLLYLERYWVDQEIVRKNLLARVEPGSLCTGNNDIAELLNNLFPGEGLCPGETDLQREAATTALTSALTVVAGGPGTGKTTTVARILACLIAASHTPLRIALAAPTGKAAVRLTESLHAQLGMLPADAALQLGQLSAQTLHKLLGSRPDSTVRFRHDAANPLPYDVVVVDECSMVALPMMARLLEALPLHARLIVVGDPSQLASVDVGAVLADIVDGLDRGVVQLEHTWRFDDSIGDTARAIRKGQPVDALAAMSADRSAVRLLDDDPATGDVTRFEELRHRIVAQGQLMHEAACRGDAAGALAALDSHRLLCAHRQGPYGVSQWSWHVEHWLTAAIPGYGSEGEWYVGRPILVTRNVPDLELANGDTGVVIATPQGRRVAIRRGEQIIVLTPGHIDDIQTLFAMTIHKAQGSQFEAVSIMLADPSSPLMTRELLYTGLTRASTSVTLYGTQESFLSAIARPAQRASGLAELLHQSRPH